MDEIVNQRFDTKNGFVDTSLKPEFQTFLEQGYELINTWDYMDGSSFKTMSPNTMTNKNMLITDKFSPRWCIAFETLNPLKSVPDANGYKWIFRCFSLNASGLLLVKQTIYVEPTSIFGQSESYIKGLIEKAYDDGSWIVYTSWYSAQRIDPSSGQFPVFVPTNLTGVFTSGEAKYLANKAESNDDSIYAKDYYELTGNELYQGLEGAIPLSKMKYSSISRKVATNDEISAKQTVHDNSVKSSSQTQDNTQPPNTTEVPSGDTLNDNGDIPDTTVTDNNTYYDNTQPGDVIVQTGTVQDDTTHTAQAFQPSQDSQDLQTDDNIESQNGCFNITVNTKYSGVMIALTAALIFVIAIK